MHSNNRMCIFVRVFCSSGVRALSVAAGINVVPIVLGLIYLLFSEALTFLLERRQLGLRNLHTHTNTHKIGILQQTKGEFQIYPRKHKVYLAHNISFWAQKLTHNVSFWAQKLCCPIILISGPRNWHSLSVS